MLFKRKQKKFFFLGFVFPCAGEKNLFFLEGGGGGRREGKCKNHNREINFCQRRLLAFGKDEFKIYLGEPFTDLCIEKHRFRVKQRYEVFEGGEKRKKGKERLTTSRK